MANKQTAVEWYDQQLNIIDLRLKSGSITIGEYFRLRSELYEQAKQMEKEQIEKAYSNGRVDEQFRGAPASFYRTKAEDYYNETYKSE